MTEQSTPCAHHIIISHRETAQWIPHLSHGKQCANPAPKAEMKHWNPGRVYGLGCVDGNHRQREWLAVGLPSIVCLNCVLSAAPAEGQPPRTMLLYSTAPPSTQQTYHEYISQGIPITHPRCVCRLRICQLRVIKKSYLHHGSSKLHQVAVIQKDPGSLHIRKKVPGQLLLSWLLESFFQPRCLCTPWELVINKGEKCLNYTSGSCPTRSDGKKAR